MHGFTLTREQDVPEYKARAKVYRHDRTGAELVSVEADDENKVFGISFRTPANDSTGIAHILEHSVLCGSRKYPVKEPFVELLKGSLQTFLNAFTYPDKTCYPVASQNLKDFYNLIDVYLDAVFYPNLTRHTFEQEGWHYEIEKPDDPLVYKGVVFNEMKGVYSSPDSLLCEQAQQSLFPDNPYGVDSGGHPARIPDLTWEQLVAFHKRYYHPSNARIWFYGDDPPEERLRLMDDCLKAFDRIDIASAVPLQKTFKEPLALAKSYPAGPEDGEGNKSFFVVNWLLGETTDPETTLALHVLEHALVAMPASPLRKALIDSGLGEDLAGVGLEGQLRQMYFSTGLKGIEAADAPEVEKLIFDTLTRLVRDGFDGRTIEAAINTTEFRLRENNTGSFPRGLSLMIRALTTWLYDGDPFGPVLFDRTLDRIKREVASGRYFERLVDRFLLKNPHRTTLLLSPDPGLGKLEEEKEKARLSEVRSQMSASQIAGLIANTAELKKRQAAADSAEALATIPSLRRGDLEPKIRTIPLEILEESGSKIFYHDLFTQGIVYLDVGMDLRVLPPHLLPYIGFFGSALLETGTAKEDFVSLAQRMGSRTGGIEPQTYTATVRETRAPTAWLFLRGKAMQNQASELLEILRDTMTSARLDNQERIKQIVLEEKAGEESDLVPSGHRVVMTRLRSRFNDADWAAEQVGGIDYLFFIRKLSEELNREWTRIYANLEEVRKILLNRRGMIFNVTTDRATWGSFEPSLRSFIKGLPTADAAPAAWKRAPVPPGEGLTIPAKVNYVGKGADLHALGCKFNGTAQVVSRYVRSTWLWDRVRVQGGAYGGFCALDQRSGMFTFGSYRDPNLQATLDIYDRTADFLRKVDLNEEELMKSIIGAVGDLDAHLLPDAKGFASLARYLTGESDERRQIHRNEILQTGVADFRRFADVLDRMKGGASVAVLGSEEAIRKAGLPIVKVL